MSITIGLAFSLTIGWMAAKLLAGKARSQGEDQRTISLKTISLKTISLDQERPRALSYTEMMNSGKQRMDQTSLRDD
ncbi:hypothetical protein KBY65_02400 [Cyanobium sp. Alchichica 3B3-8F6]|uniref:hypothetical protein n=1 Tax=unclassified Cyanobium TaxID=2627006 RepID=UPI0020CB8C7C|nr:MULTISPECIES: hypothetical protein [unclassified Cyanobium]MCP9881332.1 hypothetical protein [Cyanobium sp. Alchichica 3B3-8F6]MCP9943057.1 hypothetical protein [Cyanobium sp. ATX 6E8]